MLTCAHIRSDCVRTVAFNPKGEVLVSGGNDKMIMFWSTKAFDRPFLQGKGKEEDKVEEAKAVEQQAESADHRYN